MRILFNRIPKTPTKVLIPGSPKNAIGWSNVELEAFFEGLVCSSGPRQFTKQPHGEPYDRESADATLPVRDRPDDGVP